MYIACVEYFKRSLFILGKFGDDDYIYMLSSGKTLDFVTSLVVDTIRSAAEVHVILHNVHISYHLLVWF